VGDCADTGEAVEHRRNERAFPASLSHYLLAEGAIDGTDCETVSILKLIERRFNIAPLSSGDADPNFNDLTHALGLLGLRARPRLEFDTSFAHRKGEEMICFHDWKADVVLK
jgi:hypothetical protein